MRPPGAIGFPFIPLFVTLFLPAAAGAQATVLEWETLRPAGEEFSVQMPKNSSAETSREPYHKMTLNTRLYLSVNSSGPIFAVASLSGIKANQSLYSETERLNSYVDAFKRWFPQKVRGKDAAAKLILVGDKRLSGHAGREYKIIINELAGIAHVYATRKRFYAVAALNTRKEDPVQDKFLASFVLPDKIVEAPTTKAAQEPEKPEEPGADAQSKKPPIRTQTAEDLAETGTDTKPAEVTPANEQPGKQAPIAGGVLNSKAISLPKPDYPAEARAAKASGTVTVQITIDEYGNVTAARAVSGHPLLHQVSVNAALQAKFSPTFLVGEPVKVTGVVTYNF